MDADPKTAPRHGLTAPQESALKLVAEGGGWYWPNGRVTASLKALANRGLVDFRRGQGWCLTGKGHVFWNLKDVANAE